MIITISREFAAGGSEIARLVAETLGWTLVDNQLVEEVAARAGLTPDEVAAREERAPGFVERVARALAISTPEYVVPAAAGIPDLSEAALVKLTETVVAEIAAAGSVVMVGRAAPALLAASPAALHVRLVAPLEARVRRATERLGVDEAEARRVVARSDENRARYHRQYYDRDWADPLNYHLTLNTDALGYEGSAAVIVGSVKSLPRPRSDQG
jgi:cytidylate kinase